MTSSQFQTPMMKQYLKLKNKYNDCLLFFRLGDFYELFLEDAKIGSKILGITLTKRSRGKDGKIPMAGVPYHAVDTYIAKLVKSGYKVAICEQISEADGRNLVERDVIRVITQGTLLDDQHLKQKENNYLIGFSNYKKKIGVCLVDISTGEMQAQEFNLNKNHSIINNILSYYRPTECVLPPKLYNNSDFLKALKDNNQKNIYCLFNSRDYLIRADDLLKQHFQVKTLKSFGIENKQHAKLASALILGYLISTQKNELKHINFIKEINLDNHLILDKATIENLELITPIREKQQQGTLINLMDKTLTAMGGRMIRKMMVRPQKNHKVIKKRLDAVEFLINNDNYTEQLSQLLDQIQDIERLTSKLCSNLANPKEIIKLKNSLQKCIQVKQFLKKNDIKLLQTLNSQIDTKLKTIIKEIENTIIDDPPADINKGNLIKSEVNKKLDKLRSKIKKSRTWMIDFEKKQKKITKIPTLKIKYNKVFGFYIDISKTHLDKVPKEYTRKQTLVNSERYITQDLKEHEELILNCDEKCQKIEKEIYNKLIKNITDQVLLIKKAAASIAYLDCIISFAKLSKTNHYHRPKFNKKNIIDIKQGRHPVVENLLMMDQFIPNDIYLSPSKNQLLIITGPNMAGKSVLIRQVALITLMAHMGCFVPAKSANISLTDRIFVRSGASDSIAQGLSTFMIEMLETAYILNNATNQSLVIMDEIGRGTSTYDGISIAWAIAEYLVTKPNKQAKTLFATHYHELQQLQQLYPDLVNNYSLAVVEKNKKPVFLYQFQNKAAEHSFGCSVAKLAGVPKQVVQKAQQILKSFEQQKQEKFSAEQTKKNNTSIKPKEFHKTKIIEKLQNYNLNKMTPMQAINVLSDLQKILSLEKHSDKTDTK